jgi:hypothetical protein
MSADLPTPKPAPVAARRAWLRNLPILSTLALFNQTPQYIDMEMVVLLMSFEIFLLAAGATFRGVCCRDFA